MLSVPSDAEIERCIAPYVSGYLDRHSPEWSALVDRLERKSKRWASAETGLGAQRTQTLVKETYENTWSGLPQSGLLEKQKSTGCLWGERRLVMRSTGIKRAYLLYLYRLLDGLAPKKVLEVGCGAGTNLILLANRFPDISFCGIELTRAGIEQCERIRREPLPPELAAFSPELLPSENAHGKIEFRQGSAAELPYSDGEFDLVLTVLALEQMEQIRHEALDEITRVSSRWVIMIEPFSDWNKDGIRRRYIQSSGYFAASVSDLSKHSLTTRYVTANFPSKISLGVGLVVTESKRPC